MDEASANEPFTTKLQKKLAASRFFTFSMLLHVIIVVMGGSVVLFKQYVEPPDFTSGEGGLLSGEVSVQPPAEQPADITEAWWKHGPIASGCRQITLHNPETRRRKAGNRSNF